MRLDRSRGEMNMRYHHPDVQEKSGTAPPPQVGDRLGAPEAPPEASVIRHWMGPEAFRHWTALRLWIDTAYPGVFDPEWIYGGKKRGWSLRYKKTRAFCTLFPAYRLLSVQVVLGRAEREKFEDTRSSWSPQLLKHYDDARPYPDGKWLIVPVSSADERQEIMALVSMKRPPPSRA